LLSDYDPHPHLHSFPTRRSSDLKFGQFNADFRPEVESEARRVIIEFVNETTIDSAQQLAKESEIAARHYREELETANRQLEKIRSEEHTSELQSRFDLVCRLLLE